MHKILKTNNLLISLEINRMDGSMPKLMCFYAQRIPLSYTQRLTTEMVTKTKIKINGQICK